MIAFIIFLFLYVYISFCETQDAQDNYLPSKKNKIIRCVIGVVFIVIGLLGTLSLLFVEVTNILPHNEIDCGVGLAVLLPFCIWGKYLIYYIPSDIEKWKKLCKIVGYILLFIAAFFLCCIESFWMKDDLEIIFLFFLILFPASIILIRLSRKRNAKVLIQQNEIVIEKSKQDIEKMGRTTLLYDGVKEPSNMENIKDEHVQRQNKMKEDISFALKVNISLYVLTGLFLVASVVFFFICLSLSDWDLDEYYTFSWLLFSFMAALSKAIWYYFNHTNTSIEQIQKYGLVFLLLGFIVCVSPFYAVVSLFSGVKFIKKTL